MYDEDCCDKLYVLSPNQVDFLASFGGVTTAGGTMMGSHLQGRPIGSIGLSGDGSRGPYGRLQGSQGLKHSWLDPNFSTSSDLSCTSVMVRGYLDLAQLKQIVIVILLLPVLCQLIHICRISIRSHVELKFSLCKRLTLILLLPPFFIHQTLKSFPRANL